jgi:hypothetical protein
LSRGNTPNSEENRYTYSDSKCIFITKGGQKNKTDNCDGAFIMCGTKQWQKQRKEWYSTQHSGSQDDAYDDDSNYIQKIEKER